MSNMNIDVEYEENLRYLVNQKKKKIDLFCGIKF